MGTVKKAKAIGLAIALLLAALVLTFPAPASGATNMSVQLSDSRPSATGVTYTFTWSGYSTGLPKCVYLAWTNSTGGAGGPATGLDLSAGTTGGSYFTNLSPATPSYDFSNLGNGVVIINDPTITTNSNTGAQTMVFSNITNPIAGTYYFSVGTANAAGSGGGSCNNGSVLDAFQSTPFVITPATQVSTTIDPTFTFGVQGRSAACNGQPGTVVNNSAQTTAISLGHLSTAAVQSAGQDLTVTTNAGGGFTVYIRGSRATTNLYSTALSRGFADSGTTTPVAGTESFGYTESNTHGSLNTTFHSLTNSNAEASYAASTVSAQTQCVGFSAAASGNTPAGSYSATVIYTAVPTF